MEQMISGDDTARPPSCIGKVAFSIFKYFPYGGLQLDMMRIAREFVRRNIEVVIFCMIWDAPEPPPGISYREIKAHGLSNHRKARNFESDLIEALSTDNFIAHVAFNRLTPADWYFAADMPFVESVPRSFLEKMLPRYQTFSAMEKEVFSPENNTKIFCITRSQQADFQRLYQTPSERIFQLPPGINRSFMSALELRKKRNEIREEFGVSENETLLVQVSSAFRTKGVDRSIAALAALPENIRNSTKLLVIGRGKIPPYQTLAERCGVSDRVIFAGARDDIPELLCAGDLMIHPARNEATGTVLLESLACGTPVLCSGNCGFGYFVEESGGVVLQKNPRQKLLNRSLMLLLSTPGKLEDMQREAENYGSNGDFYRRASAAVDLILNDAKK